MSETRVLCGADIDRVGSYFRYQIEPDRKDEVDALRLDLVLDGARKSLTMQSQIDSLKQTCHALSESTRVSNQEKTIRHLQSEIEKLAADNLELKHERAIKAGNNYYLEHIKILERRAKQAEENHEICAAALMAEAQRIETMRLERQGVKGALEYIANGPWKTVDEYIQWLDSNSKEARKRIEQLEKLADELTENASRCARERDEAEARLAASQEQCRALMLERDEWRKQAQGSDAGHKRERYADPVPREPMSDRHAQDLEDWADCVKRNGWTIPGYLTPGVAGASACVPVARCSGCKALVLPEDLAGHQEAQQCETPQRDAVEYRQHCRCPLATIFHGHCQLCGEEYIPF